MRQKNRSDYTFNLANRAYFDQSVTLRPCVSEILTSELSTLDFNDVSSYSSLYFPVLCCAD